MILGLRVHSLSPNYKLTEAVSLFVKGENLLDQTYEINAGYPMPGITFFGGARVDI